MIYPESYVKIVDNSGGRVAKCIKILGSSKRKGLRPGSILVVSIQQLRSNKKNLRRGQVCRAMLVRGRQYIKRRTGNNVKFGESAVILLNDKNAPLGTRIHGPIYREIKHQNALKILSMTRFFI